MKESINFNRAATFYDATRKLRTDIANEVTKALLAEIRAVGADRVLEVGIGTGRMARPLMREGVQMVGVDISAEMMGQLVAQLSPEHTPPELLLGDATALPFRDDSFRAAMVVHVLHLVHSVPDALSEIRRVLTPGGVLLQQTRRPDEHTQRMWNEHDELWDRLCEERASPRRERADWQETEVMLTESGAALTLIEVANDEVWSSVEEELENLRARKHSWMWEVPDAIIEECTPQYEELLRARAGADGRFADRVTYVIEKWRWA